jgi:hypothetical protein
MLKMNSNKFISSTPLSQAERILVSQLRVITNAGSGREKRTYSRTNSSVAWKYFGALHQQQANASQPSVEIDAKRMYCK